MRYVLDASAAIYFLGLEDGKHFDHLQTFFQNQLKDEYTEIYVPELFFYELGNTLRKKIKKGHMDEKAFAPTFEQCLSLQITTIALDPLKDHVNIAILSIDHHWKLTHDDCAYLYLAKKMEALLLTADKELLKVAGDLAYRE